VDRMKGYIPNAPERIKGILKLSPALKTTPWQVNLTWSKARLTGRTLLSLPLKSTSEMAIKVRQGEVPRQIVYNIHETLIIIPSTTFS